MLSPDELERLDRFLEGDSPPEEHAAVVRELRERPELEQGLEKLRRLHALLETEASSCSPTPADDAAVAQVLGRRRRPLKLRPGWLVAAAALAGLGAWAYVAVYRAPTPAPQAPAPVPVEVHSWPAPGTELHTTSPGHVALSSGTAVFDGTGVVEVKRTRIRFDGRVAVSTEPLQGLAHVTPLLDDPTLETDMKRAFTLGSALVVFVIHGHAVAEPPELPAVRLASGQSWSAPAAAAPAKPPLAATPKAGPPGCCLAGDDPGVDFHAFSATMKSLAPRFDECFLKGLALNPKLQGDVNVMVHLVLDSGHGRVDAARIGDDYTLENPFVSSCLLEVLSKAVFPAPQRPDVPWISWPLQFRPGEGASPDTRVSVSPTERLDRRPEFDVGHVDPSPAKDRRGATHPAVVVYEFSDFDCSYCAKAHAALEELYRRYQDRALFIFRPLHLHADPVAQRAVAAVYAAGEQGKFWELAAALFGSGTSLTDDSIRSAADAVRLDWSRLERVAASPAISEQIAHAQNMAEAQHLRATPIVFINGRELDGARPVQQYESVLQEELNAVR